MTIFKQFKGVPGSGKTTAMFESVLKQEGRFIYAAPRTDLLDDAEAYLRRRGYTGSIDVVYSYKSQATSVDQRFVEAVKIRNDSSKAVIIVTHVALFEASNRCFPGWNILIDEVPSNAVMTNTFGFRASLPAIKEYFSLDPDAGVEGVMVLKAKQGCIHDLLDDCLMYPVANIWRRAKNGTVYIQCSAQADSATGHLDLWADVARKKCAILSVTSFDELEGCDTLTVGAAGLENSLFHLCDRRSYDTVMVERPVSAASVQIHFFDDKTKAGSAFFGTAEGKQNLELIGRHLQGRDPLGYWTCNSTIKDHLTGVMPGGYVPPLQEGSNRLREKTSCAAFYSAKATPADRLLRRVFDISSEQIELAREWEHLAQFVLRGAIRDHAYAGLYDVYVYDFWQARRLAEYLHSIGFPQTEVDKIEIEGMATKPEPLPRGRKAKYTAAERLERKRARDRAAYRCRKER